MPQYSRDALPAGYSHLQTAGWFAAGAAITAVFSGSLAPAAVHSTLPVVLTVGMIVPSFTWAVQVTASALWLPSALRRVYWDALGRICFLGSVALLPAAIVNLCLPPAPLWISVLNVLASVAVMAVVLFRLTTTRGIPTAWPMSWCLTIAVNMGLFIWASWCWW